MTHTDPFNAALAEIRAALDLSPLPVSLHGHGALTSAYPVTDLAAAGFAAVGLALAGLTRQQVGRAPARISVDRRLASFWYGFSIRPEGWSLPSPWDPIAGDYQTVDGWIRLHTNAPHHRDAALKVLGVSADREAVGAAVARWTAEALEAAIVAAGGCAAAMRTAADWARHPQGQAVAAEPLVARHMGSSEVTPLTFSDPTRPLAGIRVLDLTRVLAGPVATRTLAAYGADVLRIDPPTWEEPGVVPDVTLGKRCARLDLRRDADRETFMHLLAGADVLVHGYRSDALDRLGLDAATRQNHSPGLIDVALDAYGWTGSWSGRRGFDSLVQMSAGIAVAGMVHFGKEKPTPLPVQALDHMTGYLMAAAAIAGLSSRLTSGKGSIARLSLARTAKLLMDLPQPEDAPAFAPEAATDLAPGTEVTPWGPARRLAWPLALEGITAGWARPASELGSSPATW
jgi:crotonobetainyl-CoA:carnitine CoA-transferase CaiB-like acyl-CoA transferase